MDTKTTEVLNLLEEIANEYGLRYEKDKKSLVRDAINIISKLILSPPETEKPKFEIPEGLK